MRNEIKDLIIDLLKQSQYKLKGAHVNDMSNELYIMLQKENASISQEDLTTKIQRILSGDVKSKNPVFSKVKNGKGGYKKGYYKIIPLKPMLVPDPPKAETKFTTTIESNTENNEPQTKTLYTGKAGECAVMSELLFRGYNVNTMLVDEGVDIVASKNNVFYFVQVKTTEVKGAVIHAQIKKGRFEAFQGAQMRYIVVARCRISGLDTNTYFSFDNKDIEKFIYDRVINASGETIRLKIKFDAETGGRPLMYHENKETDISFHMNRLDL